MNQSEFESMFTRLESLEQAMLDDDDDPMQVRSVIALLRFMTKYNTVKPGLHATFEGYVVAEWHVDRHHRIKATFTGDEIRYVRFEHDDQTDKTDRIAGTINPAEFYDLMHDRWKRIGET